VEGKKHLKMSLTSNERIELLIELGKELSKKDEMYAEIQNRAHQENAWFIPENIDKSLDAIINAFLTPVLLKQWLGNYPSISNQKKVGLIMAGNIPFVGFHDFLSVFAAGHKAVVKLSSKDEVLMKYIFSLMESINPKSKNEFRTVERLENFDAVFATGSNNTSRYFEYYFGKYPNIIRRNRNGVAVLTGNETKDDFRLLANDVFDYFGLGCRNVTKLYVPEGYDFNDLLTVLDEREDVNVHHKYRNNYDYNYAIYLLNKDEILASKNLILKNDSSFVSRIACLHYENYNDLTELKKDLVNNVESIQCIATQSGSLIELDNDVSFGETQFPGLFDYADGVDTMSFLTQLS